MAVNGYPIKAATVGDFSSAEPWFQGASGTFSDVANDGSGNSRLTVDDSSEVVVGDKIFLTGADPPYSNITATVINISDATHIDTDIPFSAQADETGDWIIGANITWTDETPENFLRTIHIEIITENALVVQATLNGTDYFGLHNSNNINGFFSAQIFVLKDSLLNFSYEVATDEQATAIVTTM